MTTVERAYQRLVAANPVPEPARYLAATFDVDTSLRDITEETMTTTENRTTSSPPTRSRRWQVVLAAFLAVVAVGAVITLAIDRAEDSAGSEPRDVVERFVELRAAGRLTEALEPASEEVQASEADFFAALEAWNIRGEQVRPCDETLTPNRFTCSLREANDFHAAGGLDPWTISIGVLVGDDGAITAIDLSMGGWPIYDSFNRRFMSWLETAFPEVAAQMSVPMGTDFDPVEAETALRYVDEFVAQSDHYPPSP